MKRRDFLKAVGLAAGSAFAAGSACGAPAGSEAPAGSAGAPAPERPNILWISTEDLSPDLGCYGDSYAVTPALDGLAAQGVRFTRCFTHAGVCAPSRSGIITCRYPPSIGTHHMRCKGVPPPEVRCFTEYLRAAGYYCTNRVKTDYQFDPPDTAWDECSAKAHWRGRAPGQPFFSVINMTTTHESQIRNRAPGMLKRIASLGPAEKHDPAKAKLPPYYPDTPKVREDWAQYYDIMTLMDKEAAAILRELEEDGLAGDTIVWFWGDHGRGLPRAKRWVYDSGSRAPLLIRVPEKLRARANPGNPEALRPGTVNEDLVAFVDFGPTVLSLAGVPIPERLDGRPFLGSRKAAPRDHLFFHRDRMDEAYDCIRSVRDRRFRYVRNFMPYVSYGQDVAYMNQMPTMQEMRRLDAAGELVGPQRLYFRPTKPVEELYDTAADPHEIDDLAADPKYRDVLERMREVLRAQMEEIGDVGLLPEPEFDALKRPGDVFEKTAEPHFAIESALSGAPEDAGGEGVMVAIACRTPGASIAYQIGAARGWRLYTAPVAVAAGQVLRAKACRIGFEDSRAVQFRSGDRPPPPPPPTPPRPHWREQLASSGVLARLWAIKALDGQGERAVPAYYMALEDEAGAVRYWAIVGLSLACGKGDESERLKAALPRHLGDPSAAVRVAAAEALCRRGGEAQGLPVLVEILKKGIASERLFAAAALSRLGEKARPVVGEIRASLKDPTEYVPRVARQALRGLGDRTDD